jgi:hypothetical protein
MAPAFLTSVSESVKELDPASLTNAQLAALAALAQQVEWTLQEREIAAQREAAEFDQCVEEFEADEFRALAFASDREDFFLDSVMESRTECGF